MTRIEKNSETHYCQKTSDVAEKRGTKPALS
jgi:hypothetical protein